MGLTLQKASAVTAANRMTAKETETPYQGKQFLYLDDTWGDPNREFFEHNGAEVSTTDKLETALKNLEQNTYHLIVIGDDEILKQRDELIDKFRRLTKLPIVLYGEEVLTPNKIEELSRNNVFYAEKQRTDAASLTEAIAIALDLDGTIIV